MGPEAEPEAKRRRLDANEGDEPPVAAASVAAAEPQHADAQAVIGTVQHLWVKPKRKAAMRVSQSLELVAQEGIVGDVHRLAGGLYPRQVLVQTSATTQEVGVAAGKLRENVHLELSPGAVWPPPSGVVVQLGTAQLRLTMFCEPCGHGAKYAGIEGEMARMGKVESGRRGVLFTVLRGGVVNIGDTMRWAPDRAPVYEPLGHQVSPRMQWLIAKIPWGRVITYHDLLLWVGAPACARPPLGGGAGPHGALDGERAGPIPPRPPLGAPRDGTADGGLCAGIGGAAGGLPEQWDVPGQWE
jgi:MOSC domain-containing protein YiiM